MSYLVGVKLPSGEIVHRRAENLSALPYVTDDGETLRVVHDQDDFPFTADMCNSARAWRSHWRRIYAAAGSLSGVMQRTAKHAAKIEPLIALGLHPCGPAGSRWVPLVADR
jgi:hypothetical protein